MTTTEQPLVTVGIPTYNRAALLRRSIQSAREQDYPHLEIIVSDNCSTDDTLALCRELEREDSRIRFVRQSRNGGPAHNFATVLSLASGRYFMWLGDDDWIDPAYISLCMGALLADPDLALVGGVPHYYAQGVATGAGQVLSLEDPRGWRRVVDYYSMVLDNGIFYGIATTESIRRWAVPNAMGGDWMHIAGLAMLGRVRMISAVSVHRELGGATTSYQNIARTLGLRPWQGRFPFLAIATHAFGDVGWRNPHYEELPRAARLALALTVAVRVIGRSAFVGRISAAAERSGLLRWIHALRTSGRAPTKT